MTAVTSLRLGGPVFKPNSSSITLTSTAINSWTSDTNGVAVAGIFRAKKAMPITHAGYLQGTTTGTPGANSAKISIQGVSASNGGGDGTVKGGGSPASKSFTPAAANDATFVWVELDNPYTVAKGELFAVVVHQTASDGSNYPNIISRLTGLDGNRRGFPYAATRSGTTWTVRSDGVPPFAVKNGATPTIVQGFPIKAITAVTFNSTVQAGLQFQAPSGLSTVQLQSAEGAIFGGSTGKTITVKVFTAAGTESASYSTALDTDQQALNTFSFSEFDFDGAADLTGGADYVVAAVPGDGSTNASLLCIDVQNAEDMLAFPGGTSFLYAERASGSGAFTTTPTRRPIMALWLSDMVTGGGSIIGGDMTEYLRPYNTAATIERQIRKAGSSDFAASGDWTPATGDVKISKDGGDFVNITTLPVAVGGTGSVGWKFVFSQAEMTAARINVQIVDSATKVVTDDAFSIVTFGGPASGATIEGIDADAISAQIAADAAVLPLEVNVVKINDATVTGDGNGSPWDGA